MASGLNPIILIASCERDRANGLNDAVRNTWLLQWGKDIAYRFVLGRGCERQNDDELILDVDDGHIMLPPEKIAAAQRWALENGYGYTFHCCVDTYVVVPRLLASGYERYDYSGYLFHDEFRTCKYRNVQLAQGGAGYWLSPTAGAIIGAARIPEWVGCVGDVWIGEVLYWAGEKFGHDAGYWCWGYRAESDPPTLEGGPFIGMPAVITAHLSRYWETPKYKAAWMYDMHMRLFNARDVAWQRLTTPPPLSDKGDAQ